MRAPDGFYNTTFSLIMLFSSTCVLGFCLKKVWKKITSQQVLLAAAVGAFCFAIQIVDLNVSCGCGICRCCSFHFIGGVFSSIVLGPYLASIVLTVILLIQCVIFQVGGMITLGANLLSIVIISVFGGYYLYFLLKNLIFEPYGQYISVFLTVWITAIGMGVFLCGMLTVSGLEPFSLTCPIIGSYAHYGIIEGVITLFLLIGINVHTPDILSKKIFLPSIKKFTYSLLLAAFFLSVVTFCFVFDSPFSYERFTFEGSHIPAQGIIIPYQAPLSNYHFPAITNHLISHILAGIIGVLAAFFFILLTCLVIKGDRKGR